MITDSFMDDVLTLTTDEDTTMNREFYGMTAVKHKAETDAESERSES